ncbi:MAG: RNA methyltransferase [Muribaculaceae bacterium]|nr:RNA methyltransferase [Muribaculaceae bacterium]
MSNQFEMVAKTFQGLENVLAKELTEIGALDVTPGRRMVSFHGDLEMLYKANFCCRTALRILKPFHKFIATDTDSLYDMVKDFDWESVLSLDKTFSIDSVVNSDEFTHSRFVTYRVKDAIVDWFKDKYGPDKRPMVSVTDPDVIINVHVSGERVTLSLDSSGESLHKRGYREAQTEAPINEVLAAGIILITGWNGDKPFVDPMCGSGTFLVEAALIAANINPGVYRKSFAFQNWPDYDAEIFEKIYNDDSREREITVPIIGADISPKAIEIARRNVRGAGMTKNIELEIKPISQWTEAPANGIVVTNPPYGERISTEDMEGLYNTLGNRLKNVFKGYDAWVIGYRKEYFAAIGLSPSVKIPLLNGSLECELQEYVIFEGAMSDFRKGGGSLHKERASEHVSAPRRRETDVEWKAKARREGFGGKDARGKGSRGKDKSTGDRFRSGRDDRKGFGKKSGFATRRHDDRKERFAAHDSDRRSEFARERELVSENPLASRRNEHALKSIRHKTPSLPPQEGPLMRSRGWKKKSE